jgi:hypothetical protein
MPRAVGLTTLSMNKQRMELSVVDNEYQSDPQHHQPCPALPEITPYEPPAIVPQADLPPCEKMLCISWSTMGDFINFHPHSIKMYQISRKISRICAHTLWL